MSDSNQIILAGYSGHGFVVAEAAIESGMSLKYYSEISKAKQNPFNLEYIGNEQNTDFHGWDKNCSYILGMGSNSIRSRIFKLISAHNKKILSVIHPSASISSYSKIGSRTFIARNVSVNPLADVGNFCILNTGCIIEHECIVGQGTHIAPGTVLAGNVYVGDHSFIGANTTVKQGIKIGSNVIIGAGSVIIRDVQDGQKIAGNPGRVL